MGVPDSDKGGNRWTLDHLFLDIQGIPTLVEVKRSSNTQLRREVVGQMLDYAANAVAYWPIDKIQGEFRACTISQGQDPDLVLQEFLEDNLDAETFWQTVKTNLKTGKIRLVFVADEIPRELRRIIEFLNEQMSPAEILAVEIKQFVGQGIRSLVPTLIGSTLGSEMRKLEGEEIPGESSFFSELEKRSNQQEYRIAKKLFKWAGLRELRIWWGKGAGDRSFFPLLDDAGKSHYTFAARTGWKNAYIQIQFGVMGSPFDTIAKRRELANRLTEATGTQFSEESLNKYPSIKMASLDTRQIDAFLKVFDWYLEECKRVGGAA